MLFCDRPIIHDCLKSLELYHTFDDPLKITTYHMTWLTSVYKAFT